MYLTTCKTVVCCAFFRYHKKIHGIETWDPSVVGKVHAPSILRAFLFYFRKQRVRGGCDWLRLCEKMALSLTSRSGKKEVILTKEKINAREFYLENDPRREDIPTMFVRVFFAHS